MSHYLEIFLTFLFIFLIGYSLLVFFDEIINKEAKKPWGWVYGRGILLVVGPISIFAGLKIARLIMSLLNL